MRACVLSGGGSKGAYQIGVLKRWMGEQGIDYDIMCGVSVGAINVVGLAMTPLGKPKEAIDYLEKQWLEKVETKAIYKRWFPFGALHGLWLKSVYDSSPLRDLIGSMLDTEKVATNGRRIAVGSVSLDTGAYRFARENDPQLLDWVLASSSFPVFLTPVEMNGQQWSDGGIKSVTPLGAAVKLGATEIDVIMCNNVDTRSIWSSETKRALPDQALRVLDLSIEQNIINDLKITGLKNELAVINPMYHVVKVRLVMPTTKLADNSLIFDKDEIKRMIQIGHEDADKAIVYTPKQ